MSQSDCTVNNTNSSLCNVINTNNENGDSSSEKYPTRFRSCDDEIGEFIIHRKLLRRRHIMKERRERRQEAERKRDKHDRDNTDDNVYRKRAKVLADPNAMFLDLGESDDNYALLQCRVGIELVERAKAKL